MKLSELIHQAPGVIDVTGEAEITEPVYDSRQVKPGALFVAMPGVHVHGKTFIESAIRDGAAAVAFDGEETFDGAINIRVLKVEPFLGHIAHRFFGHPSSEMKIVGITGTNGKTTITYMLESILVQAGHKVGVIGTINYRYAKQDHPAPNTTPLAVDLARLMRAMRDKDVDTTVMEVSSHALDQDRVAGVQFDAACFTNLSRDHLDYHQDIEEYFEAKKLLFTSFLAHSTKTNKLACVNLDDPFGTRIAAEVGGRLLTFGTDEAADVRLADAKVDFSGVTGRLVSPFGAFEIASPLLGNFTVSNLLAAISLALGMGVAPDKIRRGIEKLDRVPGRLDPVGKGDFLVLVDYAHTPQALENVLDSMARLVKGRIITVFGCGGDRDPGKRPLMGAAVAAHSDISVVTSDNPRTENPDAIIAQILPGLSPYNLAQIEAEALPSYDGGQAMVVQPDRSRAIALAVAAAKPGDIVLIAGKGHEDYQIIGTTKYPFDDRNQALKALEERSER